MPRPSLVLAKATSIADIADQEGRVYRGGNHAAKKRHAAKRARLASKAILADELADRGSVAWVREMTYEPAEVCEAFVDWTEPYDAYDMTLLVDEPDTIDELAWEYGAELIDGAPGWGTDLDTEGWRGWHVTTRP